MPREIVTVQVGQCGNQLGLRWWDVMLQEHKAHPQYTDARDALFATVHDDNARVAAAATTATTATAREQLKARCVAIDMEEGVLRAMLRGPLRSLFDTAYFVSDVSGAGNNWAVGHLEYGDKHLDAITHAVRTQVERCDCLQSFLVLHSLSGGTGSGLGTRVLGMLEDEFAHVFRICPVVMPSVVDDVVTAPYNSCFALRELIEHADCVLPLDNDALARMAERALGHTTGIAHTTAATAATATTTATMTGPSPALRGVPQAHVFTAAQPTATKGLPYDSMNALVAQMLSNLTCAMRFPGPLNMDINEVTTNLVPYPRLHFLTAALAPLRVSRHSSVGAHTVDAMLSACLLREHQLVDLPVATALQHSHTSSSGSGSGSSGNNRRQGGDDDNNNADNDDGACAATAGSSSAVATTLATALIARGPHITVGDLARNVHALRARLRLPYWNEDGYKTALCGVSPLGHPTSVLMLSNSCGIRHKLALLHDKFARLYRVRSHVHHYEAYLTLDYFAATAETLRGVMDDYAYLDTTATAPPHAPVRSMRDLVYL